MMLKYSNRNDSEYTPLLNNSIKLRPIVKLHKPNVTKETKPVGLKKNLTLFNVICSIVVSTAGAGIFISPVAVMRYAGSVGASLMVWFGCGALSLALALCYCELGTAFPHSGGDYVYIRSLFGPLPAFMCLWLTMAVLAPVASALMAKTASKYVLSSFGQMDNTIALSLLSVWINCKYDFKYINMSSRNNPYCISNLF